VRTRLNLTRRPLFDVALVVAVVGLVVAAYAIAGSPWPIDSVVPTAPVVQTSVLGGHAPIAGHTPLG
jgi:hypothetical protein